MYATIYDCGDYQEITAMLAKPKPIERDEPDNYWTTGVTGDDLCPIKDEVEQIVVELEKFETEEDRQAKQLENMNRSLRRTKQIARRYIKKYNLTHMYTLTFASNLPISKKSEAYGEWVEVEGRRVWRWKEGRQPKGERIENDVYYNRMGNAFDLRKKEDAWTIYDRFCRRLREQGVELNYIVTLEYQKRGVVHFHMATDQTLKGLSSVWKLGFVGQANDQAANVDNACGYIMKYITKDLAESADMNERRFRNTYSFTVEKTQYTDETAADYDDLLNRIIEERKANGQRTEGIRIYLSSQFRVSTPHEWAVFHIYPKEDNPPHEEPRNDCDGRRKRSI